MRIGDAISALLPKDAPNVRRLSRTAMLREIGDLVYGWQHEKLNRAAVDDTLGADLGALRRSSFIVTEERLQRGNRGIAFADSPGSWTAILKDPTWPPYLRAFVSLPVTQKRVTGVAEMLAALRRSAELVKTFYWIPHYFSEHPDVHLNIDFGDSLGVSADSLEGIEYQLVGCGLAHLAASFRKAAVNGVTLLIDAPNIRSTRNGEDDIPTATWIAFPDGRFLEAHPNYLRSLGMARKRIPAGSLPVWSPQCAIYSRTNPPPHFPYAGDDYRLRKEKGPVDPTRPSQR